MHINDGFLFLARYKLHVLFLLVVGEVNPPIQPREEEERERGRERERERVKNANEGE